MRKITPPLDYAGGEIFDATPIGVEIKMRMLRDSPFRWLWRFLCRIFGHKIEKYMGGYIYTSYLGGSPIGGRKGLERRPQRTRKRAYLVEGYCTRCGEHFSNTYFKKHKK